MPIQVHIEVNGRPIESIHIGRKSGGTNPNDMNTYLVVKKNAFEGSRFSSRAFADVPSYSEWTEKGVSFTHRYGDGIETCVRKGLEALEARNKAEENTDF
jgi:hypothetical protein